MSDVVIFYQSYNRQNLRRLVISPWTDYFRYMAVITYAYHAHGYTQLESTVQCRSIGGANGAGRDNPIRSDARTVLLMSPPRASHGGRRISYYYYIILLSLHTKKIIILVVNLSCVRKRRFLILQKHDMFNIVLQQL